MNTSKHKTPDWYEDRNLLKEDMIFLTNDGPVKLDRRVPGDGTQWYVADWCGGSWVYYDGTIEPGDLVGEPINEDAISSLQEQSK